jgi:hypothetical protein
VQSANVGDAKVSFIGTAKPAVLDTETGLTVNTLAGASFTDFTVEPTALDSNTCIAWIVPNGGEVVTYQRGVTATAFDQISNYALSCAFGHDGHLYYGVIKTPLSYVVEKSYYDGSSLGSVYTLASGVIGNVAVSPNNATIVGDFNGGGIFSISSTGTNYKVLDASGEEPCISPDSTTVAFVKSVGGVSELFTIPIGGGSATQVTDTTDNYYFPCYSPDQLSIGCDADNGATRVIATVMLTGPGAGGFLTNITGGPWATHASFSPDGTHVTYATASAYNPSGTTSIDVADIKGYNVQTVGTGSAPTWSPFPAIRQFIGTNGTMFTTAAGIVYTQQQNGFQSLVTFQATTPADAKITLESQTGSPTAGPLVYDLHADDITGLRYANLYVDTSIGISIGTSDVLLTIDANSGMVDAVAPFLATRGGKPTASKVGTTLVYKGHFTGVWNASGKNVAPSGATTLVLDAKKGTLLSAQ